jgi:hypothetical protein
VGLEEDKDLEVRRLVVLLLELDRAPVVDAPEDEVLVVPDRDVLKLGRRRDNLEQALELGPLAQRHAEDLDRHVRDVVVW